MRAQLVVAGMCSSLIFFTLKINVMSEENESKTKWLKNHVTAIEDLSFLNLLFGTYRVGLSDFLFFYAGMGCL